ncbi:hypothetical protein M885DRAFT_463389 [Pelagophyceae sp. CCMP2097]|nr:hypothetical protein M885DRAFT_463389 [Pelagophyceae sp. CCMP2097]
MGPLRLGRSLRLVRSLGAAALRARGGAARPSATQAEAPRGVELYVKNLAPDATAHDVRRAFERVCRVADVVVPRSPAGACRGYGFVTLGSGDAAEGASAADALDGSTLLTHKMFVAVNAQARPDAAHMALNTAIYACETSTQLLAAYASNGNEYNSVNLATSLRRIGAYVTQQRNFDFGDGLRDDSRLVAMVNQATTNLIEAPEDWNARALTEACRGLSKIFALGECAPRRRFLDAAAGRAVCIMGTFDALSVSALSRAYASMRHRAPQLFRSLAIRAREILPRFGPSMLANTLWAHALQPQAKDEAFARDDALFTGLSRQVEVEFCRFRASELVQVAFALQKANFFGRDECSIRLHRTIARALLDEPPVRRPKPNPAHGGETAPVQPAGEVTKDSLFARSALSASFGLSVSDALLDRPPPISAVWLNELDAKSLTMLLWAYAKPIVSAADARVPGRKLEAHAVKLFSAVAKRAQAILQRFSAGELAKLSAECARAGVGGEPLFAAIAKQALHKLQDEVHPRDGFQHPRDVPLLLWSFAKADFQAPALFAAVSKSYSADYFAPSTSGQSLRSVAASDLASLAWAFSRTAAPDDFRFYDAVAADVALRLRQLDFEALCYLGWAFATQAKPQRKLFEAMTQRVLAANRLIVLPDADGAKKAPNALTPWQVAGLASSFSKLDGTDAATKKLFDFFSQELFRRSSFDLGSGASASCASASSTSSTSVAPQRAVVQMPQIDLFDARSLATLAAAFAHAGVYSPKVFASAAARVEAAIDSFSAPHLSRIVWAIAKHSAQHRLQKQMPLGQLYQVVSRRVLEDAESFAAEDVSRFAWAFAAGALRDEGAADFDGVFEALGSQALKLLGHGARFKDLELASLSWAFASARLLEAKLFDAISHQLLKAKLAELQPQVLANVAWAFARVPTPAATDLLEALARALQASPSKLQQFSPQGLTNLVWALSTARISCPAFYAVAADVIENRLVEFDPHGLTYVAWAYATAAIKAPSLFRALEAESRATIVNFSSLHMCNVVWAFTRANVWAPSLLGAVAIKLLERIQDFEPANLTKLAWVYARASPPTLDTDWFETTAGAMRAAPKAQLFSGALSGDASKYAPPPELKGRASRAAEVEFFDSQALFAAISSRTVQSVESFKPGELALMAWAFSKSHISDPLLFRTIAKAASRQVSTMEERDFANLVWAFAKNGFVDELSTDHLDLFESVATEAPKRLAKLSDQHLSNIVWAYAKASIEAPNLFDAVAEEAASRASTLDAQAGSVIAWSFSRRGHFAPALFQALGEEVSKTNNVATFSAQNLSITAWAFAKQAVLAAQGADLGGLEYAEFRIPEDLFEGLAVQSLAKIDGFSAQQLSALAWAFVNAGISAPPLFEAIDRVARSKMCEFGPQELANVAWAFASACHDSPPLFKAIAVRATPLMVSFKPQELANLAWACANTGVRAPLLFVAIGESADRMHSRFNDVELRQLDQFYTYWKRQHQGNGHSSADNFFTRHPRQDGDDGYSAEDEFASERRPRYAAHEFSRDEFGRDDAPRSVPRDDDAPCSVPRDDAPRSVHDDAPRSVQDDTPRSVERHDAAERHDAYSAEGRFAAAEERSSREAAAAEERLRRENRGDTARGYDAYSAEQRGATAEERGSEARDDEARSDDGASAEQGATDEAASLRPADDDDDDDDDDDAVYDAELRSAAEEFDERRRNESAEPSSIRPNPQDPESR